MKYEDPHPIPGTGGFLRESSGSTNIEKTLLKALKVLKLFDIPHFVCGGFAVQEHGYPRFTVDVDVIVPDVAFAIEKLSMNGFRRNPGSGMTVTDRETKVEVDLLPGEKDRSGASHAAGTHAYFGQAADIEFGSLDFGQAVDLYRAWD